MLVPAVEYDVGDALLAIAMPGVCAWITVACTGFVVTPLPVAVAAFVTYPAVLSAVVTVYVAVQLVVAPAARGPEPQGKGVPAGYEMPRTTTGLLSAIVNGPASDALVPVFLIT